MSRLSPGRLKSVLELYGQQLEEFTSDEYPTIIDLINLILLADPTIKGIYLTWLVKQLVNGKFRIDEDEQLIKEDLRQFEQLKPRLPIKDINRYDLYTLRAELNKHMDIPNELITTGNIVYDGPLGTLIYPTTELEAIECGKGTRWCTAAKENNMFSTYQSKGPLIIWILKGGKYKGKYLFHFEAAQFMDSSDVPIKLEVIDMFQLNPILKKVFQEGELRLLNSGNIGAMIEYAKNVIGSRWMEAEKYIIPHPVWRKKYLKEVVKGRWLEAEPYILMDLDAAIVYARDVIKGRWLELELRLLNNPELALQYAISVIRGRWFEAESYIMLDPKLAFQYANLVVRGRWLEAEPYIMNDKRWWSKYRSHFRIW